MLKLYKDLTGYGTRSGIAFREFAYLISLATLVKIILVAVFS